MALSIKQELLDYMPAHNPMPVVIHDALNYSQTGYKYILDVYINGVFTARLKSQPDPTYNYGLFEISKVVAGSLTTSYTGSTTEMFGQPPYKTITVKGGYEYISGGSITQSLDVFGTFNTCIAFNGGFSYVKHAVLMNHPSYYDDRLLSDSPATEYIVSDSNAWVDVINKTSLKDIEVKRYTAAGALIGTDYITNVTYPTSPMVRVAYGPAQISGGGGLSLAATEYYTVRMRDNSNNYIKTMKTVYVKIPCDRWRFTDVKLHFLNEYGGWDYIDFDKKNSKYSTINRTSIKAPGRNLTSTGYEFLSYLSGDRVASTQYKNRMILNSDFKTDAEFTWLEQLATSPLVYMRDETFTLLIVNVTDVEYEHKKFVNNKLSGVTLSVEYSLSNNRQRF